MTDKWNAFMDKEQTLEPTGTGVLNGQTFAVKDVYSIAGHTCTAGNPDWLRTHNPSDRTASSIQKLLAVGAKLTGTLQTDELMYSLNGENAHYGTPVNPSAPDRIPGGSSSGSASAVSAGLVDFSLGTDTGGSVRIPSSYCGLYGIRPTHNLVSSDGVIPLAKSFDTVGWMAQDAKLLAQVGEVLLPSSEDSGFFQRILLEEDAWALLDPNSAEELKKLLPAIKNRTDHFEQVRIADEGLSAWAEVFRTIQALEIWEEHGPWITKEKPSFGPGIADRFQMASMLKKEECQSQFEKWKTIRHQMNQLLGDNGLLVIPTAPGPAPVLNLQGKKAEEYRKRAMQLTCIAGLAGLPQVTLPLATVEGLPVGLSIIAGRNQDQRLLDWVVSYVDDYNSKEEKR